MTNNSSRDIEFAIRLAIEALRREMETWKQPSLLAYDPSAPAPTIPCFRESRPPEKRRRDVERAITILKAIKAGVYDGEE